MECRGGTGKHLNTTFRDTLTMLLNFSYLCRRLILEIRYIKKCTPFIFLHFTDACLADHEFGGHHCVDGRPLFRHVLPFEKVQPHQSIV